MCAENRFVSCKTNDIVVFFHTCFNTCGSIKVNVSPRQTFISTQSNKLVILQIPFSWRSHSFNRFQQLRALNNRRNYFSLSKMKKKLSHIKTVYAIGLCGHCRPWSFSWYKTLPIQFLSSKYLIIFGYKTEPKPFCESTQHRPVTQILRLLV